MSKKDKFNFDNGNITEEIMETPVTEEVNAEEAKVEEVKVEAPVIPVIKEEKKIEKTVTRRRGTVTL